MASPRPPFHFPIALLGGVPAPLPDTPVLAIFLTVFTVMALIYLFQTWQREERGRAWNLPLLLFLSATERALSNVLLIAWTYRRNNMRLAVAAEVFLRVGVPLLYVVNLMLSTSVFGAVRGTRQWLNKLIVAVFSMIGVAVAMTISATTIYGYTLDRRTINAVLDMERAADVYLLLVAVIPGALLATVIIRNWRRAIKKDSEIRMSIVIVTIPVLLCLTMAVLKAGVLLAPSRSSTDPAWYHSKACMYTFEQAMPAVILALFLMTSIDSRHHRLEFKRHDWKAATVTEEELRQNSEFAFFFAAVERPIQQGSRFNEVFYHDCGSQ